MKNEYTILGNYVNRQTKVKTLHNLCGHEYYVTPANFLKGRRCPNCRSESAGVLQIIDDLKKLKIKFEKEYKIAECKNKRALPFDFAILNDQQELKCLIEYDGPQHYKEVKWYGGIEGLKATQHRDSIKSKYCIDNQIPLIRIPYYDFNNISTILTTELTNLGILSPQSSQVGDQ